MLGVPAEGVCAVKRWTFAGFFRIAIDVLQLAFVDFFNKFKTFVAAKRANKIVDAATPRTPPPKKRPSTTPQTTAGDEEGASLLDRVGAKVDSFSDSTGRIDQMGG